MEALSSSSQNTRSFRSMLLHEKQTPLASLSIILHAEIKTKSND